MPPVRGRGIPPVLSRGIVPFLGLLSVLVTALGALCLCVPGHDVRASALPAFSGHLPEPGPRAADRVDRARTCVLSGRDDRCAALSAVGTPATGPEPHPCPQGLPSGGAPWPAVVAGAFSGYAAPPRPPDLHVLQVLRT